MLDIKSRSEDSRSIKYMIAIIAAAMDTVLPPLDSFDESAAVTPLTANVNTRKFTRTSEITVKSISLVVFVSRDPFYVPSPAAITTTNRPRTRAAILLSR